MTQYDFVMAEMIRQLAFEEKFLLLGTNQHADDLLDMEFSDDFDSFMCDGDL
jgi:hypothetical protein